MAVFLGPYTPSPRSPVHLRATLKEQLHHILALGELRNVAVQVMPHDREVHAGLNGNMILLETAERRQLAQVRDADREGGTGAMSTDLVWFKSSWSGSGGECPEIALTPATIHIRDSKNPTAPVLKVALTTWSTFLKSL